MEVANDLVDTDPAFNTAPFPTLLIKVFRVVFALALLNVFSSAK